MATHSSILAWRIPWTKEPGGLYSPWGHKKSDRTEQLTLSLLICTCVCVYIHTHIPPGLLHLGINLVEAA